MESLQVRTGQISLQILDDSGNERGIFKFNPEDIESYKKILEMQNSFVVKSKEFEEKTKTIAYDDYESQVAMLDEVVSYYEGLIDDCFGAGSSKILFGDAKSFIMFNDFMDGILPYYERASKQRVSQAKAKYRKPRKS